MDEVNGLSVATARMNTQPANYFRRWDSIQYREFVKKIGLSAKDSNRGLHK